MKVEHLKSIDIKVASPQEILKWSHGEVTKPETINYRTQRPEKDGLFCEVIFGPERDYECYCGKYKRIRYKGIVCERCGVEVTKASVRRERMGHIKLVTPVSHIWFLRGVPSRIAMMLDIPMSQLERVIYFGAYIITSVNEDEKKRILTAVEKEYKEKRKKIKAQEGKGKTDLEQELQELRQKRDTARSEVGGIRPLVILSESEYYNLVEKYRKLFKVGMGAEVLKTIFESIDLKKEITRFKKEVETASPQAREKILARLKLFESMHRAKVRPEWVFLSAIPVLPPDLRPMVQLDGGRYASSDLNDLYRRVINRNNRLKYLLDIHAPDVIVRNEKRMLQEAVDALIDNGMRKSSVTQATTGGKRLLKSLADMLKGKQGRFRQNLLGKRVDYSGRSVIVVGPRLKIYQCGLPKIMALELFKPFIIQKILERELAYNVRGASRLIDQKTDEVWGILEEIVKGKLVLLNRAPTLHRLSVQAFQPVLIEGEAIQLHPLVCKAYNADFDGDQMAVHLPLSGVAQEEARTLMLSSLNLLKPATGTSIATLYQDISLGSYWLTKKDDSAKGAGQSFASPQDARLASEFETVGLHAPVKVRAPLKSETKAIFSSVAELLEPGKNSKIKEGEFVETTVGRIIFNASLPANFPFQNYQVGAKQLDKISDILIRKYPADETAETLDKIKETGFHYACFSGISWGIDDLIVPEEKKKILQEAERKVGESEEYYKKGLLSKEERREKIIEVWSHVKSEIEKLVPEILPTQGSVFSIIDSGSRGSWSQPVQMAGMKGLVINPAGRIIELPVRSSYKEGLNVLEYFISTHGARKGTADTALRTSTAGYLTRRLVDVAHDVIVEEEDCGDKEGVELFKEDSEKISQNFMYKIVGRTVLEEYRAGGKKGEVLAKAGDVINWEMASKIEKEKSIRSVRAKTPLTCKSIRGVCQKCYGWDLGANKLVSPGSAAGIIAAQSIGEPGTQLTMKTFHTGGVADVKDITTGLPRVQEVFEARVPGGKAELAKSKGKVLEITQEKMLRIKSDKGEMLEYQLPSKTNILIKQGDRIEKGQPLWEGTLDLKELYEASGEIATKKYIVGEVQKIYVSQGAIIHDKHVEMIARQMFSRVKIRDSGDSIFTPGEIVEKERFLNENKLLKSNGKKLATAAPVLLGISKVALTTDSFLSAASFQETSRVLIKASLEGKEDPLRGLKENVIIGKLVPIGTGFKASQKSSKRA